MADTVRDMVGYLRMQCPHLPYYMGQQLIRNQLRDLAGKRNWSFMRSQVQLLPDAAKIAGTVAVTRGSGAVVGTGTAFAAGDVGRQFMAGRSAPVYTIAAVADATNLTLDAVFGGTTQATATYQILDAYMAMPANFKQFIVVLDPQNAWQLRFWVTQEDISRYDAQRTSQGQPWVLADLSIRTADSRPLFELWPYTASQRVFVARYFAYPADLVAPDDEAPRSISGDILVKGAMVDVCRWPGTRENPNMLFGKGLDRVYAAEYKEMAMDAEVEDENLMMTWLHQADWMQWPHAPHDARWLQNHA